MAKTAAFIKTATIIESYIDMLALWLYILSLEGVLKAVHVLCQLQKGSGGCHQMLTRGESREGSHSECDIQIDCDTNKDPNIFVLRKRYEQI